jgi:hypothetical protein
MKFTDYFVAILSWYCVISTDDGQQILGCNSSAKETVYLYRRSPEPQNIVLTKVSAFKGRR